MVEVIEVEDCGENIGDYDIPIHNAIIIPEGATNGDVFMPMFPDLKIEDNIGSIYMYDDNGIALIIDKKWLNAPYKGGCNLSEKPTGSESEE